MADEKTLVLDYFEYLKVYYNCSAEDMLSKLDELKEDLLYLYLIPGELTERYIGREVNSSA